MTTVVLIRVPRDLGWAQLVRAICRHARVPVSSETYWTHGYGDIHIDLGDMPVEVAMYAVELYTLVLGIEYRLEDGHKTATDTQGRGVVQPKTTV